MSETLIDIRTPLAVSKNARVELGRDGVLHVLAGPVTVHMDRATCVELTTTLARAMITLAKLHPMTRPPALALVRDEEDEDEDGAVPLPRPPERGADVRALPARLR
jgi:hypothetical protein